MRIVTERQLAVVLGALAGTPRVVVGGNFATPWRALALRGPSAAAAANASFTAWAVTGVPTTTARSVSDPSGTGTRTATPSSFPASAGMTSPVARAAPVVVGTMFTAADRARRRSLCGPSISIGSPV
jgi:hypothetical protein